MSMMTAIKKDVSRIVGLEAIKENGKWIKGLGGLLNVSNYPWLETKRLALLKPDYKRFEDMVLSRNIPEQMLKRIHTNYVLCAYIGFAGLCASSFIAATNGWMAWMPGMGAMLITSAVWMRNAYLSYCLYHRCCNGFMQFITSPSHYLPNPSFKAKPAMKGDLS